MLLSQLSGISVQNQFQGIAPDITNIPCSCQPVKSLQQYDGALLMAKQICLVLNQIALDKAGVSSTRPVSLLHVVLTLIIF